MNMDRFRKNLDAGAYRRDCEAVEQIDAIFQGNGPDVCERLRLPVLNLIAAMEFEKKYQNDSGRAIDCGVSILPKIQAMERDADNTLKRNQLTALNAQLQAAIPFGYSIEPMSAYINGSFNFKKTVLETCKKLPLSARFFVGQNCLIMEIGKNNCLGTCSVDKKKTLAIAAGLGTKDLQETILHEIAHAYQNHQNGSDLNEKEADLLTAKWLKLIAE